MRSSDDSRFSRSQPSPPEGDAVLEGTIERITFHNEENGYTVARILPVGAKDVVTALGTFLDPTVGEHVICYGVWTKHPQWGSQMQVSRYEVARPASAGTGFPPLPGGSPLVLPLADFDVRAVWDTSGSLRGRQVRLTGFVTPRKGGGWYVARLTISCCAADAQTYKVEVRGIAAPPADSWVEVTGVWTPDGQAGRPDAVPALTVTRLTRIPEPRDPYE